MRPISLGKPSAISAEHWKKWCEECFAEIERASYEDVAEVARDFTVTNLTDLRTLNVSTATTSEIARFLGTFVRDIRNRGMKRSQ